MQKIKDFFKRAVAATKEFFSNAAESVKIFFRKIINSVAEFFDNLRVKILRRFGKDAEPKRSAEPIAADPSPEHKSSTVVFTRADEIKKIIEQQPEKPDIQPHELNGRERIITTAFKKKDSRPMFFLGIILTSTKFLLASLIVLAFAGLGAVLGVANAYLGTTPELDLAALRDNALTSYIYDADGELLTSYSGMENRDYVALSEVPDRLQQAIISIEDVRFYHHEGVDAKRLIGSFIRNMSGNSNEGGSTITQQLIKNQLLTSERSYKRKIQEANLALQLEKKYSKDQILEAYLNIIPLGGTNYGVKAAAKDYFGKELHELSLRETACLAGITKNPHAFNPRRCYYGSEDPEITASRIDALDFRIDTVLNAMYTAGYITIEERDAAFEDKLRVVKSSSTNEMYDCAHFVEYAIENIIDSFIEYRGLENDTANRQAIENELRTAGYRIYLTVEPEIQNIVQTSFENYDYPALEKGVSGEIEQSDGSIVLQPQAAAVVIDQSNGKIVAMVGSRTSPTVRKTLNRAVSNATQVGSSIKPIAVYGPAMDYGAGLGTIIENIKVPIEGWKEGKGYPTTSHGTKSSFGKKYGPVSIRNGIKSSLNIVAVRTLAYHLGTDASFEYLKRFVTDENETSLHKDYVGLALGSSGISMLDLTSAYASIANGGIYNEPITFSKITDADGKTVLTSGDIQNSYRVYERSTAYMLVSALTDAVKSGTGTNARIKGITVAGKTGTNADNKGVVFAGMTGYYTSCVWTGHDNFKSFKKTSGGSGAAPLWQDYMSKILEGKEDKPILDGDASDYDVVSVTLCSASGMLATEACKADTSGHEPFNELMPKDTDLEECTWHSIRNICSESAQPAGEFCPIEQTVEGSIVTLPEDSDYFLLKTEKELLEIFPNLYTETTDGEQLTCQLHTAEWAQEQALRSDAIMRAQQTLTDYHTFLSAYEEVLSSSTRAALKKLADTLKKAVDSEISLRADIEAAAGHLENMLGTAQTEVDNLPDPEPEPDNGGFLDNIADLF